MNRLFDAEGVRQISAYRERRRGGGSSERRQGWSAGGRGHLYESRDHELADVTGSLETDCSSQQSALTGGLERDNNAYERSSNQQEALGQTWQKFRTSQTGLERIARSATLARHAGKYNFSHVILRNAVTKNLSPWRSTLHRATLRFLTSFGMTHAARRDF